MTQKTIHNIFFDAKHLIYSIIIQILGQSEMGLIHILAKKHIVCSSTTQYIVVPKVNYNYKL